MRRLNGTKVPSPIRIGIGGRPLPFKEDANSIDLSSLEQSRRLVSPAKGIAAHNPTFEMHILRLSFDINCPQSVKFPHQ